MPIGILFWVLMIIWAVFGFWGYRDPVHPFARGGWGLIGFLLLALLGWKVFGSVIQ